MASHLNLGSGSLLLSLRDLLGGGGLLQKRAGE